MCNCCRYLLQQTVWRSPLYPQKVRWTCLATSCRQGFTFAMPQSFDQIARAHSTEKRRMPWDLKSIAFESGRSWCSSFLCNFHGSWSFADALYRQTYHSMASFQTRPCPSLICLLQLKKIPLVVTVWFVKYWWTLIFLCVTIIWRCLFVELESSAWYHLLRKGLVKMLSNYVLKRLEESWGALHFWGQIYSFAHFSEYQKC